MKKLKRMQLKCFKCGNVRHVNVIGDLTEDDKQCKECNQVITESGIAEIKEDLLLE